MSTVPSNSDGFGEDGEPAIGSEVLQFLDVEPPSLGQAVPVAAGVRWCRIPMPLALDHINVWLLDHEDGCIVVDSGLNTPMCTDAWLALERRALVDTPLRGVFVTHMHPDHIGLSRWLQQRYDVPVWTSKRTREQVSLLLSEDNSVRAAAERYFVRHGVRDASLGSLAAGGVASMLSGLPEVQQHVCDEEIVTWGHTRWACLEVGGHAEGHICLHASDKAVLICGDQLLPTISPNVGLNWRTRDTNPLGSFLSSLERLSGLPADTLVLPAHGRPFLGLQARARDLQRHHAGQLEVIEQACVVPKTAFELLPVLYRRPLSGVHIMLALAEAVAHLEYLVHCGRLVCNAREQVTRYHTPR